MRKHISSAVLSALIAITMVLAGGCSGSSAISSSGSYGSGLAAAQYSAANGNTSYDQNDPTGDNTSENGGAAGKADGTGAGIEAAAEAINTDGNLNEQSAGELLSDIPDYSGEPYTAVNDNEPFFDDSDLTTKSLESYSELDDLGRCGTAYADVCEDTMPDEKRGDIGSIKPTGWHTVKYSNVDGKYLYNRCHLIGYQLTGENANPENLITGTRYMNTEGMLPFENMVADYVKETDGHVLYRVTPVFESDDLVAKGVLMEAESVEDKGESIEFNVFCYNVQPGIEVDYSTGDSSEADETVSSGNNASGNNTAERSGSAANDRSETSASDASETTAPEVKYIGNANTKKFHYPDCSSVSQMNESNKVDFYTRDEAVKEGYSPCGNCHP